MRVRELLARKPASLITIEPKAELAAAVGLIIDRNIGGLPVKIIKCLQEKQAAQENESVEEES